jgi:hypothetical protein
MTIYKNIIKQSADIENLQYAVKYDKRGLFVKENKVIIAGKTAYAYLVLDPKRRGREISKIISEFQENTSKNKKEIDFANCGKFVLLSNEKMDPNEVVPLYYKRQIAEKMFGIAKEDLGILPLRTHSERNFKGFMTLTFIALIVHCAIKNRLGKNTSIEKAASIMRTLKCKVYENDVVPGEVNRKQRLLLEDAKKL